MLQGRYSWNIVWSSIWVCTYHSKADDCPMRYHSLIFIYADFFHLSVRSYNIVYLNFLGTFIQNVILGVKICECDKLSQRSLSILSTHACSLLGIALIVNSVVLFWLYIERLFLNSSRVCSWGNRRLLHNLLFHIV